MIREPGRHPGGLGMETKTRRTLNTQAVVLLVVIALWIALSFSSSNFLTRDNISNIMLQMAIQGVIGVGAVVVILTGGIDLSVGSVVGLVNIIFAKLVTTQDVPVPAAIGIIV